MISYFYVYERTKKYRRYEQKKIIVNEEIENNELVLMYNKRYKKIELGLVKKSENNKIFVMFLDSDINIKNEIDNIGEIDKLIKIDIMKNIENISIKINSIDEYISIVLGLLKNNKILFRGQSDKNWNLQPSLYRDKFTDYKEKEIFKEYKKQYSIDEDVLKNIINMQHLGIPTRLLDWTSNPMSALFFSLSDLKSTDKDSKVYCVKPNNIYDFYNTKYNSIRAIIEDEVGISKLEEDKLKEYVVDILLPIASNKTKEYIYIETPFYNERIKAQQGFFSIFMEVKQKHIDMLKKYILLNTFGENDKELGNILLNRSLEYANEEKIISSIKTFSKDKNSIERYIDKIKKSGFLNLKSTNLKTNKFKVSDSCIEIIIDSNCKKNMLEELDKLNINFKSIYPDEFGFSQYINYKYKDFK